MPEEIFYQATLRKKIFGQQVDLHSQSESFVENGHASSNMATQGIISPNDPMWFEFCSSWNTLQPDPTLAEEFGERFRSYNRLYFDVASLNVELNLNETAGQPIPSLFEADRHIAAMTELIKYDYAMTVALVESEIQTWNIGLQQIRIVCPVGRIAYPAPEGPHREGARAFVVHVMDTMAVVGGSIWLFDNNQELVGSKTLSKNFDTLMLDEERIGHDFAPITVRTGYEPGYRDLCLITFEPTHSYG
jgi:hypothetical protein